MKQSKLLVILLLLFTQTIFVNPVTAAVQYKQQPVSRYEAIPIATKVKSNSAAIKKQKRKLRRAAKYQLKQRNKQQLAPPANKETKLGRFFLAAGIIAILLAVLIFSLPGLFMTSTGLTILFSILGAISVIGAILFPIMSVIYFAVGIAKKTDKE